MAWFGRFWQEGKTRKLPPSLQVIVSCLALLLAVFEIYTAPFGTLDSLVQRAVFLSFVIALTFLCYAAFKSQKDDRISVLEIALAVTALAAGLYFYLNGERLTTRWVGVDPLGPLDVAAAAALVLLTLEVTRRTVGPALLVVILVFIAYAFLGPYLPGEFGHRGMTLMGYLDRMVFTFDGVMGTPLGVTATYVYMFILFGTVLNASGAGNFFFRLASSIAGRMVGGPAKMAVLASAFYGTINGSPTSNVVTTGTFTIPLMKRVGYSPTFAAAVEAAASTGGSILPPIMGTAAFLAVDVAGIPYLQIVLAAAIPGVLYYLGIMLQVHYRAVVKDLRPVGEGEKESPWQVVKENVHYLIPVAVMLWLLAIRMNPTVVGLTASLVAIATSWIKPGYRMGPRQIWQAFTDTATSILTVANASAAAGLVIGGIMATGLGGKFTSLLFQATGSNPLLTLAMVALVCIILGMGMPIPAAYVLTATLAVPAMLELQFPLLAAHLFVIYFSTMSALTPPVAVAAYAGAGIAGANPNATGFQATRLAVSAYLVPFIFMYRPGLLLSGSLLEIVWSALVAAVAIWGLAGGLEGYFIKPVKSLALRGVMVVASVVLLSPGMLTDLLGLGVLGAILIAQLAQARLVDKKSLPG